MTLVLILSTSLVGICFVVGLAAFLSRATTRPSKASPPGQRAVRFQLLQDILGISALIAFLESKAQHDADTNEQEQSIQRRTLGWIIGYTVLTASILMCTIYQSYEAHQSLVDSERPWVVATSAKAIPGSDLVEVRMKNYGNSIATDGWLFANLAPNDTVWLTSNWRQACNNLDGSKRGALQELNKTSLGGWPIGFVLAPGEETSETVSVSLELSPADTAEIEGRRNSVNGAYIVACIEYVDQFHVQHLTTACFETDPSAFGLRNPAEAGLPKCNSFQTAN